MKRNYSHQNIGIIKSSIDKKSISQLAKEEIRQSQINHHQSIVNQKGLSLKIQIKPSINHQSLIQPETGETYQANPVSIQNSHQIQNLRNYYSNIKISNKDTGIKCMNSTIKTQSTQNQNPQLLNTIRNLGISQKQQEQLRQVGQGMQRSSTQAQINPASSILNEMKDINFKIQNIFQQDNFQMSQTITPTSILINHAKETQNQSSVKQSINFSETYQSNLSQQSNQDNQDRRNQSGSKKAKPQLPKNHSSLKLLNPIIEQAVSLQQEKRRSRSRRKRRNDSQQSIKEEPEEEMKESFQQTDRTKQIKLDENCYKTDIEIGQTPCFKNQLQESEIKPQMKNSVSHFSLLAQAIQDESHKNHIQNLIETQKKRDDSQNHHSRILSTACSTEQDCSTTKEHRVHKFKIPKVLSKQIFSRPESQAIPQVQPMTAGSSQIIDRLQSRNGSRTASIQGSIEKAKRFNISIQEQIEEEANYEQIVDSQHQPEKDLNFQTLQEFFQAKNPKNKQYPEIQKIKMGDTNEGPINESLHRPKKIKTRNLRRGVMTYDTSIDKEQTQMLTMKCNSNQTSAQKQSNFRELEESGLYKEKLQFNQTFKRKRNRSQNNQYKKEYLEDQELLQLTKSCTKKRYGPNIGAYKEPYENQSIDFNKTYKFTIEKQNNSNQKFETQTLKLPEISTSQNFLTLSFKASGNKTSLQQKNQSRENSPTQQSKKIQFEKPQLEIRQSVQYLDRVETTTSNNSNQNNRVNNLKSPQGLTPLISNQSSFIGNISTNNSKIDLLRNQSQSFLNGIQSLKNQFNSQRSQGSESDKPPIKIQLKHNQKEIRKNPSSSSIMISQAISKKSSIILNNNIGSAQSSQGGGSTRNKDSSQQKGTEDVFHNLTFGVFKGSETSKNNGITARFNQLPPRNIQENLGKTRHQTQAIQNSDYL
ncbi:UNKNOWN [Stylonychia lemnae]|uniref:Uncharacterized protein n=1 Tax=Stylonychia lemnae TaxID=5949 RepID=A0A078AJW6_STYLE|nr:UNKNOWN [Stylonychia lemnae]|eukprot:CDW82464.1 UNKNOWN [Stylonychia lemnae]